jgi:hypothetical protein
MHDDTKRNRKLNSAFVKHLENSSKIVRSWPTWKQSVLGDRTPKQICAAETPGTASTEREKLK